jgi:type VI secretion system secreted protein Hcp
MAIDVHVIFNKEDGTTIQGESTTQVTLPSSLGGGPANAAVRLSSFAMETENVVSIGSATSGAGAGKAKLDPLAITRHFDQASPALFQLSAAGSHLRQVEFIVSQTGAAPGAPSKPFLVFTFTLVFVQTISWSYSDGDDNLTETINLEYGAVSMKYLNTSTNTVSTGAWDQITNNPNPPPVS